ncbi:MAG: hypothetical protein ACK5PS_11490 [Desulfopila sp.]
MSQRRRLPTRHKVIVGLLCCMAGLIMLHQGRVVFGLPLFLLGIVLMNKK